MKIEIFEGDVSAPESVLRLRLVSSGLNVLVIAVDEKGDRKDCGMLVTFRADGTLRRDGGVNSDLGLQLDDRSRIRDTS